MDNTEKYTLRKLEKHNYRYLQQTAKNMSLPANVKKADLILLIHTKMFGSTKDVRNMIEGVKMARRNNKKSQKSLGLQNIEISSTSTSQQSDRSPGISATPKRPSISGPLYLRYSPETHPRNMSPEKARCDRVLRNRRFPVFPRMNCKPQTYREVIDSGNDIIDLIDDRLSPDVVCVKKPTIKVQNKSLILQKQRTSVVCNDNNSQMKNLQSREASVLKTYSFKEKVKSEVIKVQKAVTVASTLSLSPEIVPAKRAKRVISGIYPIETPESVPKVRKQYQYVPRDLGIRNKDGTFTTIKALVQKPLPQPQPGKKCNILNASKTKSSVQNENYDYTVQDIIDNTFVNTSKEKQYLQYMDCNNPNVTIPVATGIVFPIGNTYVNSRTDMAFVTDTPMYPVATGVVTPIGNTYVNSRVDMAFVTDTPIYMASDGEKPNDSGLCEDFDGISYCHKKIRSERRNSIYKSGAEPSTSRALPRIHEVFNNIPDYTESASYPMLVAPVGGMLESLFNFRRELLPPLQAPSLPPLRPSHTAIVFSMHLPLMATGLLCDASTNQPRVPLAEGSYLHVPQRVATANTDRSAAGGANASIDELAAQLCDMDSQTGAVCDMDSQAGTVSDIEDALEWISQDGDYMERMGLDVHMQCILCSWAGPKYNLDLHIRQSHSDKIHRFNAQEFNITYSLGSLLGNDLWHSEIIDGVLAMYVLSCNCSGGQLRATLTCLSTCNIESIKSGTITIYNRVSGEPHSWSGLVPPLPPSLLSLTSLTPQLAVRLTDLDIQPVTPCSKTVYGPPNYHGVQITVFVTV